MGAVQAPVVVPVVPVSLVELEELVRPVGPVDLLGVASAGLLEAHLHPPMAVLGARPVAHPLQPPSEAAAGHPFVVDRPKAGPAAPSWVFLWMVAVVVLLPVLLQAAAVVVHQMASHLVAAVAEPHQAFVEEQLLVSVVVPPGAFEEVRGVLQLVYAG